MIDSTEVQQLAGRSISNTNSDRIDAFHKIFTSFYLWVEVSILLDSNNSDNTYKATMV